MDQDRGPAERELHRGARPGARPHLPVPGGGRGRSVPDPEQDSGRDHLRHLPTNGPDQPEHGGQLRLVHRDGAGPHLPGLCLRGGLSHQEKQRRQVRRARAGGRSRAGPGLRRRRGLHGVHAASRRPPQGRQYGQRAEAAGRVRHGEHGGLR